MLTGARGIRWQLSVRSGPVPEFMIASSVTGPAMIAGCAYWFPDPYVLGPSILTHNG